MCVGAVGMSNIDKANKRALRGINIKCVRVPERERERASVCVGGYVKGRSEVERRDSGMCVFW
jgi:hypothetical protein